MATKVTKQNISVLLTKLADRDTFTMAARELDLMARQIDPSSSGSLQSFISVILSADTDDKPAVRKHCVHLLAVLSVSLPPNSLSPFLSKIITRITRRLRDPDSSIRSACVAAVSALSSRTTKPPFYSAFMKPLADTLFTEQEVNAQIGAALCLAAAIDAAYDPDPARLGQVLLPRLEKLVKCNAFKAKSAGVVVIGSVIGAGSLSGTTVSSSGGLKGLVDCLLNFLASEDWAARKAAAEALGRLATMERNELGEFKSKSLKILESRKYDKVKAVREVMNQMMEAWKQVPDLSEEVSPPRSNASSKGNGADDASDGRHPLASRVASTPAKSRTHPVNRSTPLGSSVTTRARKQANRKSIDQKKSNLTASHTKTNVRRRLDWKAGGASIPTAVPLEDEQHRHHNENAKDTSHSSHDKMQMLGGVSSSLTGYIPPPIATMAAGHHVSSVNQNSNNCKGLEDIFLIRNQLVQIEQQQSNLMDLLQRFVGSSQNGMRGLETRVHSLELALDEISYDLAVSTGRMSKSSGRNNCCLIPPGSFIKSKFWKKPESKYSASRQSTYRNRNAESIGIQDTRQRYNGSAGFIVNPLAEIRPDNGSAGIPPN